MLYIVDRKLETINLTLSLQVTIRKAGVTTNEEKQWKTKKLAVEDPYSFKRNLCRSIQVFACSSPLSLPLTASCPCSKGAVQALSVYDYIGDCLKTGYLYFGTIQTCLGPVITRIVVKARGEEQVDRVVLKVIVPPPPPPGGGGGGGGDPSGGLESGVLAGCQGVSAH